MLRPARLVSALLAFWFAFARAVGGTPTTSYESHLFEAKALASEGSHARAAIAYEKASETAPTQNLRAMSFALGVHEKSLAHESRTLPATDKARVDALLADYSSGKSKDELWSLLRDTLALSASRARQLQLRLDTAKYWAHQPIAAEANERFYDAIERLAETLLLHQAEGQQSAVDEALELVASVVRNGAPHPARARIAVRYPTVLERQSDLVRIPATTIAKAYDESVAACIGTDQEPEAVLSRAEWWCRKGTQAWFDWTKTGQLVANRIPRSIPSEVYEFMLQKCDEALGAAERSKRTPEIKKMEQDIRDSRLRLTRPSLEIEIPNCSLPGRPVSCAVVAENIQTLDLSLHRVDARAVHALITQRESTALIERFPAIETWRVETGIGARFGKRTFHASSSQPLPEGLYALVARDASNPNKTLCTDWISITPAQAIASSINGTIEVWAYDQTTGQLLGNVIAKVQHDNIPLDSVGPGHARVVLPASSGSSPRSIIGEADGHPFVVRYLPESRPRSTEWTFHLRSDRGLYLPGETARWRLVARSTVAGETTVPAGQSLHVTADIGYDTPLGAWDVTLNSYGTASGELTLPTNIEPGQVTFSIVFPGDRYSHSIQAFQVDRFRVPEARLTIAPLSPEELRNAKPGSELRLVATASYYSGEPVTEGQVTLSAHLLPLFGSIAERDTAMNTRTVNEPTRVTAPLNAQGKAELRLPIPNGLPLHATVFGSAVLQGPGLSAQTALKYSILPSGHDVTISLKGASTPKPQSEWDTVRFPSRYYSVPARAVTLNVTARDGFDAPAAVSGDISVVRCTWEEIWRTPDGTVLSGEALRKRRSKLDWPLEGRAAIGWENVREGYLQQIVHRASISTGRDGHTSLVLPGLAPGYYQVLYKPTGSAEAAECRSELFVADEKTEWLGFHTEYPFVLPSSPEQVPGEPLQLLVIAPQPGRSAIVTVAGQTTSTSSIEPWTGDTRLMQIPWKDGYARGAQFIVTFLATTFHGDRDVSVPMSRAGNTAIVSVTPLEPVARPGQTGSFVVRATDTEGHPLSAELAIGVTDAALTSLVDSTVRSIRDTLIRGRSPNVRTNRSPRAYREPAVLDDEDDYFQFRGMQVFALPENRSIVSEQSFAQGMTQSVTMTFADAAQRSDVRVRSDFSTTAFWVPDLKTDENGDARVSFRYPDSLTTWDIDTEAVGVGNRFGEGRATTRTTLPLQARLRAPRFLVVGDTASVFGTGVNATSVEAVVEADMSAPEPGVLKIRDDSRRSFSIPADAEATGTWTLETTSAGDGRLKLLVQSKIEADALQISVPVNQDSFVQRTGIARRIEGRSKPIPLVLPAGVDLARTHVDVEVSAGIVPTLVGALPFLVDYPYGCVEQTTSRFVPAAAVAKALKDFEFTPAEVEAAITTTSNRPAPSRSTNTRAAGLRKLDDVITESLVRLANAQAFDGSFGWFAQGPTDAYMTGYVLRGLNSAAAAGVAIPGRLHERTVDAVIKMIEDGDSARPARDEPWLLAAAVGYSGKLDPDDLKTLGKTFDRCFEARNRISSSGLALLTQAAVALRRTDAVQVLRRNLDNGLKRGNSPEFGPTAQWGRESGFSEGLDGAVESTALVLQALLAIDPKDPLADEAARWLLVNRQSNAWSNTRDTAQALLALLDYAKARGETTPIGAFTARMGNTVVGTGTLTRQSLLAPVRLEVNSALLRSGTNKITVTPASNTSTLYVSAAAQSWAPATAAQPFGGMLTLRREYSRIEDFATPAGLTASRRTILPESGARVARNDRLECRLIIEAANDLDYILIESPAPAGAEPMNPLSAWDAVFNSFNGNSEEPDSDERKVFREEFEGKSAFFLRHIPAGKWELRYTLRATFGGDFRILPATATAMYAPAISTNTTAQRLSIQPTASSNAK